MTTSDAMARALVRCRENEYRAARLAFASSSIVLLASMNVVIVFGQWWMIGLALVGYGSPWHWWKARKRFAKARDERIRLPKALARAGP